MQGREQGRVQGNRRTLALLLAVGALALAARVAVALSVRGLPPFEVPVLDSRFFLETGKALARGESLPPRPFFMSPGYTLFVTLFAKLFDDPLSIQRAVVFAQALLDAAACVLVARLAARKFGSAAGVAAGALLALHGPSLLFSTRMLDASLGAFLVALLATILVAYEERPGDLRAAAAGLVVGLLALLRATALSFIPLALIGLAFRLEGGGIPRIARHAGCFVLSTLLVIAPVTLRNWKVSGEFVPLTTSIGVNLYIGNAPGSDGRFTSLNNLPLAPGSFDDDPTGGRFELSARAFAEKRSGRPLTSSETSTFFLRRAWSDAREAPLLAFERLARKLWLFFNAFEIPQVDNVYFLARFLPAPFGLLAHGMRWLMPLALLGLVAAWKRAPKLALLFAASHALAIALLFVTDRYRLWIVPIVALLAGAGAAELGALVTGRVRRWPLEAGVLVLAGVAVNLDPSLFEPSDATESLNRVRGGWFTPASDYLDLRAQYNNLAARLLDEGNDPEGALREARAGVELAPRDPTLRLNLARALVAIADRRPKEDPDRLRLLREAAASLAGCVSAGEPNPGAARLFGLTLYQIGDFKGARDALERFTRLASRDAEAWNTLGAARLKLGDGDAALAAFRRSCELAPSSALYRYNLGLALVKLKRFDDAVVELDPLARSGALDATRETTLAEALIGSGRAAEGEQRLREVLAREPGHLGALLLLAESCVARGDLDAARPLVERALAISPRSERGRALREKLGR